MLHVFVLLVLKRNVCRDFKQLNILDQILHSIESTSFAFSIRDWDFKKHSGPNDYYVRMKEVQWEVSWNIVINWIFSVTLLMPMVYLCKYLVIHT